MYFATGLSLHKANIIDNFSCLAAESFAATAAVLIFPIVYPPGTFCFDRCGQTNRFLNIFKVTG